MVVAPPDRGKTTLVRLLVHALLERGKRVGWVDADLGQSQIGPPTTVGACVLFGREVGLKERLFTPLFRFLGDTTPEGDIVALALYTFDLVRSVKNKTDVVVLDTCGLFHSPAGYLLKMLKIRLIEPEVVIALGNSEEFVSLSSRVKERLITLPIPSSASRKHYEYRRLHRQRLFSLYFSIGREVSLPLEALRFSLPLYPSFFSLRVQKGGDGVRFSSVYEDFLLIPEKKTEEMSPHAYPCTLLEGLICGLFTSEGGEVGLGIIESINCKEDSVNLWAVQCSPGKIACVVPGALRLERNGIERGHLGVRLSPLRLVRKNTPISLRGEWLLWE
ncbi:MAG: Clp1/GlmU family protein [Candidatus Caldatribacteriaceae bacterium]